MLSLRSCQWSISLSDGYLACAQSAVMAEFLRGDPPTPLSRSDDDSRL